MVSTSGLNRSRLRVSSWLLLVGPVNHGISEVRSRSASQTPREMRGDIHASDCQREAVPP